MFLLSHLNAYQGMLTVGGTYLSMSFNNNNNNNNNNSPLIQHDNRTLLHELT